MDKLLVSSTIKTSPYYEGEKNLHWTMPIDYFLYIALTIDHSISTIHISNNQVYNQALL